MNDFKFRHDIIDHNRCRFCEDEEETIEHVLMKCTQLDYKQLKYSCVKNNVKYTVKNLLQNSKIKYEVEKFIVKFLVGKM